MYMYLLFTCSFQSWFDFSSVVDEKESSSHIIAREREENVLTTLHEVYVYMYKLHYMYMCTCTCTCTYSSIYMYIDLPVMIT